MNAAVCVLYIDNLVAGVGADHSSGKFTLVIGDNRRCGDGFNLGTVQRTADGDIPS